MPVADKQLLNIQETVARCQERGLPVSGYTLRRAIRTGAVPCRIIGRTYLLAWPNVERWLLCADSCDNAPRAISTDGIRPVEVAMR